MLVNVSYQKNFQFEATARGHAILGDQPLDNGGDNAGMTPPEWFLASLGSCVGFYAVKYCQARELDPKGLNITVSAQKTSEIPTRIDEIIVRLTLPYALPERHQKGLKKAVEACIIHNTLVHPPHMKTEITSHSARDPVSARSL